MMTHVDDDGEVRTLLTDFGIARNINDISGLTTTNMDCGHGGLLRARATSGEEVDAAS